jgi:AcrR family transcriptional regulator
LETPVTVVSEKSLRSVRKAKGAGHLRRGEILHAAERIFVREGYHGATIRKIADEVGLSSTALYMHFRDKSEILVEICEEAFAQLIAQNDAIAAKPAEPAVRVREILDAYMQFGLDNPNAYQLVFATPPGALSDEKVAVMYALGRRCYSPFRDAVQEIGKAGKLRHPDVDVVAETLWAGAHGLVSLLLTQPHFEWSAKPPELKALMLDSLFNGMLVG